ncbi:GMC family oxidoreductase [Shewanella psychropiezotolerans]|uniref:GMC family oxidoreductase n=1 Tax=Shewanella psychropiezotolerans TaxID=2593655 RepID=A0ABX5X4E7_9GAMM|nr:GMC family oxidoreductase N-terminal domain-containing protein [Shewanella psychropiezotolerans]QDO84793.1 GMC family oxidoreductase [Shewanella psychropiezotolerans]
MCNLVGNGKQPDTERVDVIIVGTGPGGASVAKKLAEVGQSVVMLEWGDDAPLTGQLSQMVKIAGIPGRGALMHADMSLLMRGITVGGSSAINFATAMAPPLAMFQKYGIDLTQDLAAMSQELPINTLPDHLIGPLAGRIHQGALSLGHDWQKLQKFVHIDKCRASCHRCTYGCPFDAKWTAREFVDSAIKSAAALVTKAKVTRVLQRDGRVLGVEYHQAGSVHTLLGDKVILAAGGVGSPRILQNSCLASVGLDTFGFDQAGKDYFVDPVIAVMGTVNDLECNPDQMGGQEIPMAAGMHLSDEGITLADLTLPKPLYLAFATQVGRVDRLMAHDKTLSIMVKVKDELGGKISQKWLNKSLTSDDKFRLARGTELARSILTEAGATKIFNSHHFAAHPGGGAKIGELVDENLETGVKGLFVCDASVIPESWGLPPSYTLLCLGHRLGRYLS